MKPIRFPRTSPCSRRALVLALPLIRISTTSAIVGTFFVSVSTGFADMFWQGDTSSDWNTAANWTNDTLPAGQWTVVNEGSPHTAVISAPSAFTPTDLGIGKGAGKVGRLDHTAGTVQTGAGNWMWVGTDGANGTYNLADTNLAGGTFTGFGTGTGSATAQSNLLIGASGGTGVMNVNTQGTLTVSGQLRIADLNENSHGTLNVDAGTVSVAGNIQLAKVAGGSGSLRVSGGTITGKELRVGYAGATGEVVVSGGSITTDGWTTFGGTASTGNLSVSGGNLTVQRDALIIGDNGTSTFAQTGGDVAVVGELMVGQGTGSGIFNFSAGTLTTTNWVSMGRAGGTAVVNVSGGTWNHNGTGTNLVIGATQGVVSTGTMNFSGGLVNVLTTGFEVGEWGTGTLTISDAAELRSGEIRVGLNTGSTGTINFNGGTVRTHRISGFNRQGTAGAGTSTVHFDGTQIIASADDATFITALDTAEIKAGGLKINTNGFTVATSQTFSGSGTLTKTGTGTLALNGAIGSTGTVIVNEGMLGGNFGMSGGLEINATAKVSPGNGVGLIFAGETKIAGTYLCEIEGATSDLLDVSGTLTITGATVDFSVLSAPTEPVYEIATYTSLVGTFNEVNVPAGYSVVYGYEGGNKIALVGTPTTPTASYDAWAASFELNPLTDGAPGADADDDGQPNSVEYAFGGDPTDGANNAKIYTFTSNEGASSKLLMTVAVRVNTPAFSAGSPATASFEGFTYSIEGSTGLDSFLQGVSLESPVVTDLPPAPTGYEYRTFSLDGSAGLPNHGFLRAKITR